MGDVAVSVEGLGKRYRLLHQQDRYGRLTESLTGLVRAPVDRLRRRPPGDSEWFWALRDVSFQVKTGDVLGIVGRNGAGKSTLLKILSRITEPTEGRAELHGRVASLLEVGTGFHPELSGRENIYVSGSVLGMRKDEIARRFDEIVAFADVEQFLDTPVKRYSSGMQVRLGFAVAAHLEPEILVVDEVLAVGDAQFQRKCLAKMDDVSKHGRTVLFVSHSMPAVQSLCDTALLLHQGSIVAQGSTDEIVDGYLAVASAFSETPVRERADRKGDGRVLVNEISCSLQTGGASEIRLGYTSQPGIDSISVSLGMFTIRGEGALYLSTDVSGHQLDNPPPEGEIVCRIDRSGLLPGLYTMNIYVTANGILADWIVDAASIEVTEGDLYGTGRLPPVGYGSVAVPHAWTIEPA